MLLGTKKKTDTNIGGWDIVNRKMNHVRRFTFDELQLKFYKGLK